MNAGQTSGAIRTISSGAMRHFMASMLTPSLQVAMNELSNHDHSRFLTRTNHIVGRARACRTQSGGRKASTGRSSERR